MKLLISGSRTITEKKHLLTAIREKLPYDVSDISLVIHGGADGIDTLAEEWATDQSIPTKVVRPNYDEYDSKYAPIQRNKEMVQQADVLLAVKEGESKGTQATINFGRQNESCEVYVHILNQLSFDQFTS